MSIKSSQLVAVVVMGSALVLGGCGVPPAGDEPGGEEAASLATHAQAVTSGWTVYTSDARPPVNCDGSSLISGVQCEGRYCDNMRLQCQPTVGVRGSSYWTGYTSWGSTLSWASCATGYWATGLTCEDSWCGTISIQCTRMTNTNPRNCYTTGWMSEENGGQMFFPAGYYPTAVSCAGDNCDHVSYSLCQL